MRANMAEYTPMSRRKLAKRRKWIAANGKAPLTCPEYSEHRARRDDGGEVSLFVVNAKPGAQGPGILHLHGGGFTASSAMGSMPNIQQLARQLDCPIVTVDYRLAPETPWSGSLEDNYAALRWMHHHAGEIGIDPARIAVLGESAGGGHAALLTVAVRDRKELSITFQALVYPMLDDRSGTSRRLPEHIGWFGWNPEANRFGWASYLGCRPGGRRVPCQAIPARIEDLAGLPPAFISVGGLDLFVEENIDYARRLNAAGVPTELLVVPGAFHGFDMFVPGAKVSQRFAEARASALRRGLGIK